jgi:hypothetical protein
LEATAAAGQYGHTEGDVGRLFRLGDDLGDSGGGAVGNGELFHGG